MRAYRIIEYDGADNWVKQTLAKSIQGTLHISHVSRITAIEVSELPKGYETAMEMARLEEAKRAR